MGDFGQWANAPLAGATGWNGTPGTNAQVFQYLPNSERSAIVANGGANLSPDQQAYGMRLNRINQALWSGGYTDAGNNLIPYLQQKYGEGRVPESEIQQIEQKISNPTSAASFAQEASASLLGARQAYAQGGQPALAAYQQTVAKGIPQGGTQQMGYFGQQPPMGGMPQRPMDFAPEPGGPPADMAGMDDPRMAAALAASQANMAAQQRPGPMGPPPTAADAGMGGMTQPYNPYTAYLYRSPFGSQYDTPGYGSNAAQQGSWGGMAPPGTGPSYMQSFQQAAQRAPQYYAPPPPAPRINPNGQFRQAPMGGGGPQYQQAPMAGGPQFQQRPMDMGSTAMARPSAPPQGIYNPRPPTGPPPMNPFQSGMYTPNAKVQANPYQQRPTGALLPQGLGR